MKNSIRRTFNRGQTFDWFHNKFSRDQLMQIYIDYFSELKGERPNLDLNSMGRCKLAAALEDLDSIYFNNSTRH